MSSTPRSRHASRRGSTRSGAMTVFAGVLVVLLAPLSLASPVHASALTPQTITFGAAPTAAVGDSGVAVSATSDSGLPVTYSTSTPAVCSVDPNSGALVLIDAGTCTVLADQAGDATYDVAPQASLDVTVDPAAPPALTPQTITFGAAPFNAFVGKPSVSVSAAASSGLPVTYTTSTPLVCSVDVASGLLDLLSAGTCTVLADQAGDATYDVAPQASLNVAVAAEDPTRGCRSYTGASFVGSVVLNADGTPIGCGPTGTAGSPSDLVPTSWPSQFVNRFGTSNPSYTTRLGWACDDCWIGAGGQNSSTGLPIGFPINFYGTPYSEVFVNSNGSISFGAGSSNYDEPLDQILNGGAGVVAYGMDLDNREIRQSSSSWGTGRHGDFFYWGRTIFQGHQAFVATWMNIQPYFARTIYTNWNTFQVMLVDIDGNAGTNVDIIVNYGSMQANTQGYSDTCTDNSGTCVAIGLGSVQNGAVQYASIVDDEGVLYNGRTSADVADDGAHPLSSGHLNSTVPGRFKFQMRNGTLPQTATPPGAPTITSAVRGDAQGTISWSDPSDLGGSPISGYTIHWRTAGSSDAWTTTDVSASPETITGLTNGVTYEVEVAATNGTGTGPFSAPATFTPGITGSPEWTDLVLAEMVAGVPFADAVAASGTPTPTYSVVAGALPDGLSLDPITGAITGTPTATGPFDFTVQASNGVGSDIIFQFTGAVEAAVAAPTPTASVAVTVTIPPTSTLPVAPGAAGSSGSVAPTLLVLGGLAIVILSFRPRRARRQRSDRSRP